VSAGAERPIALTFDDGPGPSTERLLDVLTESDARATFFVLGRNLRGDALDGDGARAMDLGVRVVRDGHWLGNHTVTHALGLSEAELLGEVEDCDELVRACHARAGHPPPSDIPLRLPFGGARPDFAARSDALRRRGRAHCDWNGNFGDWRPGRTVESLAAEMIAHVELVWAQGDVPILLLHDAGSGDDCFGVAREVTVDAVVRACRRFAAKGVRYVSAQEARR
jgi:peptidoglycan-N-acetylglucosamine deacetylase